MECLISSTIKSRLSSYTLTSTLTLIVFLACSGTASSQEALRNGSVAPMGQWLEYREANFRGNPVLVHLRTGYERAIVMPEPVKLQDSEQKLPGSEILINDSIVAFYPTRTFTRRSIVFVGQETGTLYDLRIRASTQGMRQPMRINRP